MTLLRLISFHPLYRGTWFPTGESETSINRRVEVSIRYVAVLGFQHDEEYFTEDPRGSFHPLYSGTWFPTFTLTGHMIW